MVVNERITEDMVNEQLKELGFYDDPAVSVEKQQTEVLSIHRLLSKAGKAGKGGRGYPEFIITFLESPDVVVIIECKASVKKHASKNLNRPVEFALDGVLSYARALSSTFTVIGIAVSGTPHSNQYDVFLINKGTSEMRDLIATTGKKITSLVPASDFIASASFDEKVQQRRVNDLISFSRELHEFMRDEAELEEKEKPLAVAGSLIALSNTIFRKTYQEYPAKDLPEFWMKAINTEFENANLPVDKIQPFTGIEVHPELKKAKKDYPQGLLNEIITMLADKVLPFLTVYHDFDIVGQFYGEFLRYSGGDGKSLGIVLTPRHITELFALLANVNTKSKVLDICSGTGGFLISAMTKMLTTATSRDEVKTIKSTGLIGVEQQPTMYALAASNMILRGDGKANLHQGSCFDTAITEKIKKYGANIGLLNPPFSKTKADLHELRFVGHMLDCLDPQQESYGIAIVPVSCATSPSEHKENLLKKHTLIAGMSMPTELFYPVGVVTCLLVFRAHIPHEVSNVKTWFGYWREDGFIKVKKLGRIDKNNTWTGIRDRWVDQYRNREVRPGQSVQSKVTATDEWVAEAYMETDYSTLTEEDFRRKLMDYALFTLQSNFQSIQEPGI